MSDARASGNAGWWLLILPAFLLMTGFYVAPILQVLTISVTEPSVGLDNYERLFTNAGVQRAILTTLRIGVITTAIALCLGYALSYVIALASPRAQRWWLLGVLVPLWISVLVNEGLRSLGAIDAPLELVWNEFGIVVGMVHYMVPYAVLPMLASMREIDPRLLAAARGMGASRFTAFSRVFLPLSTPGLIAAGVLVFIFSLGFYITPAILGGGKTLMAAEWIKIQILDIVRWGMGTMLATVLYLVLPITIVIPVSFTDQRFLSLPHETLSLRHYANLFGSEAWLSAIGQSAMIAVASTLLAVVAGTLCAIGCWRIARRSTELLRALMLLPLIIPSIVYAIGLYRYFGPLGLLDRFLGATIAHGVTGIPYVVITVSAALASFDPRLEQAARGMGASLSQTLRWVILPRIMPGIASGAIFAFIHSWDELVIVLFIASRQVFTLPRKIWDGINENLDPTMAAVAVLLIVFTVLLLFFDGALRKRRES